MVVMNIGCEWLVWFNSSGNVEEIVTKKVLLMRGEEIWWWWILIIAPWWLCGYHVTDFKSGSPLKVLPSFLL